MQDRDRNKEVLGMINKKSRFKDHEIIREIDREIVLFDEVFIQDSPCKI